jgi:hypothetical protein
VRLDERLKGSDGRFDCYMDGSEMKIEKK